MNSEDIKSLYSERKPTKHDDYHHDISGSVSEIFKVARNIVEHYKGINKYKINPERYNDIDIIQPEIILDRLSDAV